MNIFLAATAAFWGLAIALVGGRLTVIDDWYYGLTKPGWKPPDWSIGPIWTVILILGAWSLYRGVEAAPGMAARITIGALFLFNGACNVIWNVLFFACKRPDWALAETFLLILSIAAPMLYLLPIDGWAALMLLPYLVWVSIACYLTYDIVRLNRPFAGV